MNESEYQHRIQQTYLANISKMNAFSVARGALFLLVLQPELANKKHHSDDEKLMLQQWNQTFGYLNKTIPVRCQALVMAARKYCEENKINYLDINNHAKFTEYTGTLFFPNAKGHEFIAELIIQQLERIQKIDY